jgi:hypothetical protein
LEALSLTSLSADPSEKISPARPDGIVHLRKSLLKGCVARGDRNMPRGMATGH